MKQFYKETIQSTSNLSDDPEKGVKRFRSEMYDKEEVFFLIIWSYKTQYNLSIKFHLTVTHDMNRDILLILVKHEVGSTYMHESILPTEPTENCIDQTNARVSRAGKQFLQSIIDVISNDNNITFSFRCCFKTLKTCNRCNVFFISQS